MNLKNPTAVTGTQRTRFVATAVKVVTFAKSGTTNMNIANAPIDGQNSPACAMSPMMACARSARSTRASDSSNSSSENDTTSRVFFLLHSFNGAQFVRPGPPAPQTFIEPSDVCGSVCEQKPQLAGQTPGTIRYSVPAEIGAWWLSDTVSICSRTALICTLSPKT